MPIKTTVISTDKDKMTDALGEYLRLNFTDQRFARVTDRYEGVTEILDTTGVQDELAEIIGYYPEATETQLTATQVSATKTVTLTLTVVFPDVAGPGTETIQVPLTVAEPAAEAES
ncbi:hypothetical protein LH991_06570 [Schleiferilactobacillus harbinensis]|jgi:hypothetical protein|uniref:Uncharacterized protein n=1 Tax=Schleiferilactobacillus harbinensis DSM 16991 TaxID=1122147 RepID=A0A0R1XI51_9LACO|nr:hypothetical protein [Schleiferilactobacillus harbinensis]KRM26643.1 hypothetical protein FC91_GL002957 [Schleiferilactobacillus harbinensis DSM 16991]MCI1849501.1 hypothetical protein [Schleiferilactobacillus harbinensis]QEU48226.1 hypothetical protein FMM01_13390 [Schleiferilactobacillus harbinensis]QFR63659.1 hypothetical protein LH991_06570 [Schleiferilactobacillus harbinensis]